MSANIDREPKLIIQLRKSGTTRQARKKYKVTDEGFAEVGRMIAAPIENA
jgi:DNA-binding PadR family transcriptional regulator